MHCGVSELLKIRFIVVTNDNLHDDAFFLKKMSLNTRSMIALTSINKSHIMERVRANFFHVLCFHEIASEAR